MNFKILEWCEGKEEVGMIFIKDESQEYVEIIKYAPKHLVKGALVLFPGQFLRGYFYEEMLKWFASQGYIVFCVEYSFRHHCEQYGDLKDNSEICATIQECIDALRCIRMHINFIYRTHKKINILGHSLGGEFVLQILKYLPEDLGIAGVVIVESALALKSIELRNRQEAYCNHLEKEILSGVTCKSSRERILGVAIAALKAPDLLSEIDSRFTNLEFFRLAVGATSSFLEYPYTPEYCYFMLSGDGVKKPLLVNDERKLLELIVGGYCDDKGRSSIFLDSSIWHEYSMSKVLAGECKIDVPVGTNGFAIFFDGGIGPEGEQGMKEAGFETEVLPGAHASIVHCPQSQKVWERIKEFLENE
jgi:pimeloyl-ACP methyl ester carboxylesterase